PMVLPEFRDPDAGRPDLLSGLLCIAAMLAAIYGLKQVVQDGLTWFPVLSMLIGIGLAASFMRRQQILADPMLDLTLFRDRVFNVSLPSNLLHLFVSLGSLLPLIHYLQ